LTDQARTMVCCFLNCLRGAENRQFLEDMHNNSFQGHQDGLIQHRLAMPHYRFLIYMVLTGVLVALAGAAEVPGDALFGSWFWALALGTFLMAFYYPVMIAVTPNHFAIRMKLLQLLCVGEGWLVFKKTDVVCMSESYEDLNQRKCSQTCTAGPCGCCCCLGFEDWANLSRAAEQKTLTFQFDKSVSWGEFLTVTLSVHESADQLSHKTAIRVEGANGSTPGPRTVTTAGRPRPAEGGI